MIDATSTAHLTRMLPRSPSLLSTLEISGAVRVYPFEHYSIVGYNSLPNMVPLLTGLDAATFLSAPQVCDLAA